MSVSNWFTKGDQAPSVRPARPGTDWPRRASGGRFPREPGSGPWQGSAPGAEGVGAGRGRGSSPGRGAGGARRLPSGSRRAGTRAAAARWRRRRSCWPRCPRWPPLWRCCSPGCWCGAGRPQARSPHAPPRPEAPRSRRPRPRARGPRRARGSPSPRGRARRRRQRRRSRPPRRGRYGPAPGAPPPRARLPAPTPASPPKRAGNRARPRAELPRGRAEPRPAGKEGPRKQTHQPSPEVSPNAEAAELCSCFFCCLRSPRPQVPAPGTGHTHTSPLRPTGSQIHVHET